MKEFPRFGCKISANLGKSRRISAKNRRKSAKNRLKSRPKFDQKSTKSQLKSTKWALFVSQLRWWESTPKGVFHTRVRGTMFVRNGAVTPGPSRECDITFFVKGRPKSARQSRDSTVAARSVQSVTVPSSRVSRECRSPGLRSPPLKNARCYGKLTEKGIFAGTPAGCSRNTRHPGGFQNFYVICSYVPFLLPIDVSARAIRIRIR